MIAETARTATTLARTNVPVVLFASKWTLQDLVWPKVLRFLLNCVKLATPSRSEHVRLLRAFAHTTERRNPTAQQ